MEILTVQYCTYRIQSQRRHETGNVLVSSLVARDHPDLTVLLPIPIEMNEHWTMRTYQPGRITQVE
jgi:hypothetical protein